MHKSNQSIRSRLLVARLPSMPQILIKLIDLCQRDEAGMDQVAKLVAHDVGMTAKILRIANSNIYSSNSLKLDLAQSLNKLGLDMIKTLVINESIIQTFSGLSHLNDADINGFWLHAIKAAVIARELAKEISYFHGEEAYLAGLLHDVGQLALLSVAPHEYPSNLIAQDDEHLCSIEKSSVGITHAEAGAWLIEQWNLDSFLADSVLYHHEPIVRLKSAHPLIRIVCLAHLFSSNKSDDSALEGAATLCGIDEMDMKSILSGVDAYTKTAATYFGIDVTDIDQVSIVPEEPVRNKMEETLAGEVRNMALVSATAQSFSNMHNSKDLLESIVRTARILFNLEDMLVLLQSANPQVLVGFPIGDHQQRLSEFSIPLVDGGTIGESVSNGRITFVGHKDNSLGLVEEQLLRAMGTECLVYMPMIARKNCLGVLVGGFSSFQSNEMLDRERFLKSFSTQAATSLGSLSATRNEIQNQITNVHKENQKASRRVIHEVNNPLSIIKNYLSVLDEKLANNESVSEDISIINEEIDRVSRIVGGLVEPQPTTQGEATDVNGVVKDVVRLFSSSRFLPASVKIVVKTTDQRSEMIGSADPIKQILLNLIKNAVEALHLGGEIEVRNNGRIMRGGRAYIELCICDNGAGIPSDVLASLFSPVHSNKSGGNRGLGLNIVQRQVKKINGFISCRSGEWGTVFEILLPTLDATDNNGNKMKQAINTR